MQRFRFSAFAAVIVLLAGISFSVQAQEEIVVDRLPLPVPQVLNGTYSANVDATELSRGTVETATNSLYGWSFYGATQGDLSGHIFVSVNYSLDMAAYQIPSRSASPTPPPSTVNPVTGGSWSKLIYVDGVYTGSISGTIVGGTLTWDYLNETAQVQLELSCNNGTGDYAGNTGLGTFTGVLNRTKSDSTVVGSLTLNY